MVRPKENEKIKDENDSRKKSWVGILVLSPASYAVIMGKLPLLSLRLFSYKAKIIKLSSKTVVKRE